jgi:hypothetical protein
MFIHCLIILLSCGHWLVNKISVSVSNNKKKKKKKKKNKQKQTKNKKKQKQKKTSNIINNLHLYIIMKRGKQPLHLIKCIFFSNNLTNNYEYIFMTLSAWASEWLLANSKWVIFQLFLYHDNMRQETCLKNEVLKFQEYDDLYKLFWMNL